MKKMTIVSFQQLIVLPEEAHRLKDFKLAYKELDFFFISLYEPHIHFTISLL